MIIHQPSDKKIKLYKWVETLDRKHRDLPRELIRSYHKKKIDRPDHEKSTSNPRSAGNGNKEKHSPCLWVELCELHLMGSNRLETLVIDDEPRAGSPLIDRTHVPPSSGHLYQTQKPKNIKKNIYG